MFDSENTNAIHESLITNLTLNEAERHKSKIENNKRIG
jgi:hypothetical protein